jgi:hypothetical protein
MLRKLRAGADSTRARGLADMRDRIRRGPDRAGARYWPDFVMARDSAGLAMLQGQRRQKCAQRVRNFLRTIERSEMPTRQANQSSRERLR